MAIGVKRTEKQKLFRDCKSMSEAEVLFLNGFTPTKAVEVDEKLYNLRGVTIGDVLFTVSNFGISADEIYTDAKLSDIIF